MSSSRIFLRICLLSESFRWTIPETKSCNCNFPLRYEPQLGRNWPSKKQFCYKFSSSNFRRDLSFCHHSFVEVRQELNLIKNWTWLKMPEKDKKFKGWVHFQFFLCLYYLINNKTIWSWKKTIKKSVVHEVAMEFSFSSCTNDLQNYNVAKSTFFSN